MKHHNLRIGSLTMIIAFMLTIMPLPNWAQQLRPDWVALCLIYWVMAKPANIGVTIAWLAGIMLDVSQGSVLGQHALGLTLVIYIAHSQHQRLLVASLLQQALVIFVLLLLKQLLSLWVSGIMGHAPDTWLYFLPSLIGAMLWPWIFIIMRDLQRKFGHQVHY